MRCAARSRGHTLIELCVSLALLVLVGAAVMSLSFAVRGRHSAESAYALDLEHTWRALDRVEHDLRSGRTVHADEGVLELSIRGDDVSWLLTDGHLIRSDDSGQVVVARSVGRFDATHDGEATSIALAPRRRTAGAVDPAPVRTTVRARVTEDVR